ncbi:B-cell lymphoma 3 protein [Poecile atricapillus]|uniref:B-cell lymphoma 3 protein n=1 Tax=Poecile atricapillus TaxID=48891 RepID=UPI002738D718|nr:B-cell lymphoma 3 protein [Poecile atricapillus]
MKDFGEGVPQIWGGFGDPQEVKIGGKNPKFGEENSGIGAGLRAEPPLAILGGGAALGVTPPQILGVPEPPLAAAIAAATRQDEDGDTPLHIAVAQGSVPVARRLVSLFLRGGRDLDVYNNLRQGASPMAPDRLGRTCAHLACGSHLSGGGASAGPRPRVLRELLRGPGPAPDLQARDYEGLTPLHVAVGSGSRESALVLLEHGADIDAVDIKSGRSPLLHAVENNSLEMAELLLQHGASVNAQSYAGCTALHAAAGRGLLRLLRLLLRCGADCGLRNLHNDTAAGVAASAQVIDILRGKASRPPQDPPKPPREPPHGCASESPPTSGSAANGVRGAQGSPAHRSSADQSEAAVGRLRPRGGRGRPEAGNAN